MKKVNLPLSLLAALIFIAVQSKAQSVATPEIENAHPGTGSIFVVGDSLADGRKATKKELTPTGCLARLPNKKVYDRAVSGLTSERVLKVMQVVKTSSPAPHLIFISSAGNDARKESNKPGSYPEKQTMKEMEKIFDIALNTGAVVAYLGLNPPVPFAARLPKVSALAESKGIIVVDGMNGFWENSTLMADDLHPNDKGYAIMCDRMIAAISPYYP
jgi:lysophospholipase L1-like esterase